MKIMTMGGEGKNWGQRYDKDLNNEIIDRVEKSMLGLTNNQETLCQRINTLADFATKVMHLATTTLFFW